jgi:hypothetical protein
MVFTRTARLRWEKVADYLCEIVQYILEVDSLYMEYEPILVWHATLCQTMEYPTVPTLAQSLYKVVVSMSFGEDPEFEFVVNVATQDRVFPHYVPNSSIKHSKSDSKDRSQEIL